MIALLHKLDSTLEALRRKIGAAQDAISRLEEDMMYFGVDWARDEKNG